MFGNQLIEGLMRGCQGIVAEGTALAENVRRFGNGVIVPQNDPASLASAIGALLSSVTQNNVCENARMSIRRYMGPDQVAREHASCYHRIVNHFKGDM